MTHILKGIIIKITKSDIKVKMLYLNTRREQTSELHFKS